MVEYRTGVCQARQNIIKICLYSIYILLLINYKRLISPDNRKRLAVTVSPNVVKTTMGFPSNITVKRGVRYPSPLLGLIHRGLVAFGINTGSCNPPATSSVSSSSPSDWLLTVLLTVICAIGISYLSPTPAWRFIQCEPSGLLGRQTRKVGYRLSSLIPSVFRSLGTKENFEPQRYMNRFELENSEIWHLQTFVKFTTPEMPYIHPIRVKMFDLCLTSKNFKTITYCFPMLCDFSCLPSKQTVTRSNRVRITKYRILHIMPSSLYARFSF